MSPMKKLSCIFCFTLLLLSACSSQSYRSAEEQDFDQPKAAKTRISLGLTYLKNGNFSQAKYNLDKALQFDPRSADAHFALAYYYQQVEEHDAAEKAYQEAMDLEPRNADIANSYGAFLCQRGKYAEAKRYFLKAVNSDNYISSAETYENLALCSQTHGELEDALEYLRSAVNHQPGRGKSLYLLAQLLAESNHWVEAKDVLRRYEKVSQVSPNTLLLASQIEHALGNSQLSKGYGEMLLRMYPSDPATARYLQEHKMPPPATSPIDRKSNKILLNEPLVVVEDADIVVEVTADNAHMNAPIEVSESSPNKESIMQLAENSQEIERAEKDVVEKSKPLTKQVSTFHIVQKDENLYRISLLYNIRMQRLVEWNRLPNAAAIYEGKKLIIVAPENQE